MVMNHSRTPRLKPLLNDLPPGFIVDTAWLKGRGIDAKSIHNYVKQGWIARIVRGIYRRPLPTGTQSTKIPWEVALLSLQRLMSYKVHLGGRDALNLAGFAHFIMMGEGQQVHFYGNAPSWLKRLPTTGKIILHQSTLFGDNPVGIVDRNPVTYRKDWTAEVWRWPIRASCPERAILELIADLRGNSDFEYVELYFQSLTSLRPKLLMTLLKACRSVKVRRLFFVYADLYQHIWRKELDIDQIDFGSGPRALVPGGKFHPTYQISLPEYFLDTSYEDDCIF